jgi:hypothetical protein
MFVPMPPPRDTGRPDSPADFPATLLRLFRGDNLGKLLLRLR